MAEKPAPTPPAPAPTPIPSPVAATAFTFEPASKFPKPVKAAGAGKGVVTETTKKLSAVPVDHSFLVEVKVPDTITEINERNEHFKAEAKKELSRVNGAARRLRTGKTDTQHSNKNFTTAIVSSAELGYGVRVWRDEDTAVA